MFDVDQLITDCRASLAADPSHKLIYEVVARAISDPASVLRTLGEPKRAQLQKLYQAPDLTILNLGTYHDHSAPRPSNVGRHWPVYWEGGQFVLAAH